MFNIFKSKKKNQLKKDLLKFIENSNIIGVDKYNNFIHYYYKLADNIFGISSRYSIPFFIVYNLYIYNTKTSEYIVNSSIEFNFFSLPRKAFYIIENRYINYGKENFKS